MKRTTAGIIVVLVVVAAVAGYLIELAIVANGGFAFAPPVSLKQMTILCFQRVYLLGTGAFKLRYGSYC